MRDAIDEVPDPPDWLSPDYTQPTESAGEEQPANEPATGAGEGDSPPPPRRALDIWRGPGWPPDISLGRLTTQILDTLDSVGDRIAEGLGLR